MQLNELRSQDFAACLGTVFRACLDGIARVDLELAQVREWGEPVAGGRQPFTLHFLGPLSNQYLAQNTYRLEHERLGALDIFIVPLGPEGAPGPQGQRMRYEAVFS